MTRQSSKSSNNRKTAKHQVDEQRVSILEAAAKLFLQNGLENTSMVDIANQAGFTRVTLYRYFANRDEVAVEVHLNLTRKTEKLLTWTAFLGARWRASPPTRATCSSGHLLASLARQDLQIYTKSRFFKAFFTVYSSIKTRHQTADLEKPLVCPMIADGFTQSA